MPHKNKSVFIRVLKTVLCIFLCLLILVISACAALACYARAKSFTTTDFNSYLKNGTHLEDAAIAVLPPKEDLDTKKIAFYEYEYNYGVILPGVILPGDSMLRLVVIYDADDFNTAWQTLDKQYLMQDEGWRERFYFDGDLYHCYTFYGKAPNVAYAMSYSINTEEKKISYMLYESFDITVMSAQSALSLAYGEDRITPAS